MTAPARAHDRLGRTPGQALRRERDLMIAALVRVGFSRREVARVFDLPRSRVAEISAAIEAEASGLETDRARESSSPRPAPARPIRRRKITDRNPGW